MGKQSIIFLGSKPVGYHCLAYLIERADSLDLEITGVLCNVQHAFDEGKSVRLLAEESGLTIFNSPEEMPDTDLLYSVQYHQILKQPHIDKAKKDAFNLHMAPLPEYRGCNQFSFAILDGRNEFGTTIHRLDARIDHGDILFEKRFSIPEHCWVQQLYELTFTESLELFKSSLEDLVKGNYSRQSQQSLINERGSSLHFRNEIQDIKKIDMDWSAEKIDRHIRATSMPGFEPPFTFIGDKKVYFCNEWK